MFDFIAMIDKFLLVILGTGYDIVLFISKEMELHYHFPMNTVKLVQCSDVTEVCNIESC